MAAKKKTAKKKTAKRAAPRSRSAAKRKTTTKRKTTAKRKTTVKSKTGAKRTTRRKTATKREIIDTGTNKLYVRRNALGTSFKEVEDVGRSLTQDRRRKAKNVAKPGQGDRGDRARAKKKR